MTGFLRAAGRFGPTAAFVCLWSSGAIFIRLGLDHASPLAFLSLRFALALLAITVILRLQGRRWPRLDAWPRLLATGLLLVGAYAVCYMAAMDQGMTPGAVATIMGLQPVLTLVVTGGARSRRRVAGLALALAGLVAVVWQSLAAASLTPAGAGLALAALAAMTAGALLQKRSTIDPLTAMPVQYLAALALCLIVLPTEAVRFDAVPAVVLPLLWLALVISVGAQLLFYRLIRAGDLVNVTSLFYLVPAGTVLLDFAVFGTVPAPLALCGMAAILGGIGLVFGRGQPAAAKA